MKTFLRRVLKLSAGLLGVLILVAAVIVATNFTLIKNMPSAQDGGADAMYIANQTPLQRVGGADDKLTLKPISEIKFNEAHENWEKTGGKALLIWHKGELVYETYAEGVSPADRSRSFSMHKSILGLVAATMEADGIINLDDPISQYVDAYKKGGREALTIRDMLIHKSGLERYKFTPPSLDTLNMLLSHKVEKTALKAKVVSQDPVFDYSNINYQVAGAAIRTALEEKTSQTYAQYLSSRIWEPIGADDAFLWAETQTGAPRFYAGMQASPRGWLKVGIMLAQNNGDVIPQSAVNKALLPSDINEGYGLGIWLGSPKDGQREYGPSTAMTVPSATPFSVPDTVFFDGFGGQRVYISQEQQLVIVRIGDVRFDWDDTALPNLVAEELDLKPSYSDRRKILTGLNEREVTVRILSRSASCKNCKLAILSHGAFAGDDDYDAIAKPLADMGYQVFIPTHTDSTSHPLQKSFDPQDHTAYRIEDHQLILDHVAKTQGADTPWIAVGHSFGAMISSILSGITLDENLGNNMALGLPSHNISLSPPNAIESVFPADAFSRLESPTLLVTGTTDLVPTMIDDWEKHLHLFEAAPKGKVTAIVFDNQNHYFNGLYGRIIERPRAEADDDLIMLMKAFLDNQPLIDGNAYQVMQRE